MDGLARYLAGELTAELGNRARSAVALISVPADTGTLNQILLMKGTPEQTGTCLVFLMNRFIDSLPKEQRLVYAILLSQKITDIQRRITQEGKT